MPELELAGATLYYETTGRLSSPAITLVHAGIANLRMWDPLVGSLARHHFVIAYDTRGFGRTFSQNVEYSDRADLIDLLDHLGLARSTIVGASRGGIVAIDTALEYPDRVAGVVTIGSGPSGFPDLALTPLEDELAEGIAAATEAEDWTRPSDLETRFWSIGPTRDESELDPDFVRVAYDLNRANLPHSLEEATPLALEPPAYGRLAEVTVPALVTVGEKDISALLAEYDYLIENLPAATGYRFSDTAHLPSVEKSDEFASVLLDWLGQHAL